MYSPSVYFIDSLYIYSYNGYTCSVGSNDSGSILFSLCL